MFPGVRLFTTKLTYTVRFNLLRNASCKIVNPRRYPFQTSQGQNQYIPLKAINVDATIRSFAADVTVKQIFRNEETQPVEAVYCFPIEEKAAVYSFTVKIDDREIVSDLKEKKTAQQEYSDALLQGHGAHLLEQNEKSHDMFMINVGALPPGKECHVSISYVSELDLMQDGRKIRFVVPTTIAPRYDPSQGGIASPGGTTSKYAQSTPYTIQFRCQVEKVGIARVSSLSHPIQVDVNRDDIYTIEFSRENTHLDRDILLDLDLIENRPNMFMSVETGAVMVSFTPTNEDFRRVINHSSLTNEFIFVVDCSGSMQDENKIGLARQALLLFLKSLPISCRFNIIRFLKPLEWLEQNGPNQGHSRQVFVLTDGEILNVDEVIDRCRSMSTSTRIFSFGLGHSPSRLLVKGLARATHGRFVFIPPNESVDIFVGEQLRKALQSSITNVKVKWNMNRPVKSVPKKLPPVYANDRLIVYGLNTDSSTAFDPDSTVELYRDENRLCEARIDRIPNIIHDSTIARLAAKALILELQNSKKPSKHNTGSLQGRFHELYRRSRTEDERETHMKEIIELSLKYKILSPYTAFIGVEKRTGGSNAGMILREVPVQVATDDQHLLNFDRLGRHPFTFTPNSGGTEVQFSLGETITVKRAPNDTLDSRLHVDCSTVPQGYRMFSNLKSESKADDHDDLLFEQRPSELNCSTNILSSSDDEDSSSFKKQNEQWPTDDQDTIRLLISKQQFDGLWESSPDMIEKLSGKTMEHFKRVNDDKLFFSALIVHILETRFATLSAMWYGIVQKARQRLLSLVGNDEKQLDSLIKNIRQQLQ